MKEDMVSDGVSKIIVNLKNFKPEKGTLFSYMTRCVFTACIDYLSRHYRDINNRRKLFLDALEKAETNMPSSQAKEDFIRELGKQIELYSKKEEDNEHSRVD